MSSDQEQSKRGISETMHIQLPEAFSKTHIAALGKYFRNRSTLSRAEWSDLFEAIDLLRGARVTLGEATYTFAEVYESVVEAIYADTFVQRVLLAKDIAVEGARLRDELAKRILGDLREKGLYDPQVFASQILSGFCLYWWYAFTKGYAFEIEIIRDLEASGLAFTAHDLRTRKGRRSPYDLIIQGYQGDIKSSTYFMIAARTAALSTDFYITLLFDRRTRRRMRVVMLQEAVWAAINGETRPAKLEAVTAVFPAAAEILVGEHQRLIVVEYERWKQRLLQRQKTSEEGKQ